MEYELRSALNGRILEITISGRGCKEVAREIALKVIGLVMEAKTKCVLIDVRSIQGTLGILETMDLLRSYPHETPRVRTALVDKEENRRDLDFFETAAQNKGYSTRYFTDMDSARQWLNS